VSEIFVPAVNPAKALLPLNPSTVLAPGDFTLSVPAEMASERLSGSEMPRTDVVAVGTVADSTPPEGLVHKTLAVFT
jgi:hypothetical protein